MKKTTIGILFIGLLLMAPSASSTDAWWNTSYQYRAPVVLTGNTSGAQTDYQLMFNVSYNSNMQSTFDDLRFTDNSGNLQSAWLENKINDSWADIWVNFTSTPANSETQTYYMYYGNTEVSNYWNSTNTFEFFDDFNAASIDTNKWNTFNTVSQSGGVLTIGGTTGKSNIAISKAYQINDGIIECRERSIDDYQQISIYARSSANSGDITGLSGTQGFNEHEASGWEHSIAIANTVKASGTFIPTKNIWYISTVKLNGVSLDFKTYNDNRGAQEDSTIYTDTGGRTSGYIGLGTWDNTRRDEFDWVFIHKYASNSPTYSNGIEEEYTVPSASSTPTPTPTPTPLKEITSSNYVIQNQTLYITQSSNIQYKITSNSFVYGGLRNINTVICDNNNTVISGWFKISTDKEYDADYTFLINVNDTSYESKIITLKQQKVDSSIISKVYRRSLMIDGYEIYSYNTTVYIVSIIPNPIYFYFNLEDDIIQFGDKQFDNQTLVFNQLNFDDQYCFMDNASSDTVAMRFKAVNPSVKSGAELKGLTGLVINAISKVPFIGKSLKTIVYYPLFFVQALFNFIFTFLDIIVNDWWYGLMLMEIVCIFAASRNTGYANVMEVYIDTHVKIIKFIYEWIILNMINLMMKLISLIMELARTVKDMIKWW